PAELREMAAYVGARRALATPFEIIVEGETPGADRAAAAAQLVPWAEAGATWWLETLWHLPREEASMAALRRRIAQGPPAEPR
ncbi:MAG: LLM class flavin-dependent oxidoreductase, partial [Chloroflexales bacterium]